MSFNDINPVIKSVRFTNSGNTRHTFILGIKANSDREGFLQEIKILEGLTNVRFELKDSDEQL